MAWPIFSRGNLILHKLRPPAARPFSGDVFRVDFFIDASRQGEKQYNGRCRGGFRHPRDFPDVDSGWQELQPGSGVRFRGGFNPADIYAKCFPAGSFARAVSARKPFAEWEDDAGLYIRLDMPGLGRENVEVEMEDGATLVIRGVPGQESEVGEGKKMEYKCLVDLPANVFKTEEIKVDMNNGVLKVVVPKITAEERVVLQ